MAQIEIDAITAAAPAYYGTVLKSGSSGPDVAQLQTWLNGVRSKWGQLPLLTVDGKYGSGTTKAVNEFQTLTGLKVDGHAGSDTWNRLSSEYASLHGAGEVFPGITTRQGSRGAVVKSMQQKLNLAARRYTAIQSLNADGIFGSSSASALRRFQEQFGLTGDSLMGRQTFDKLKSVAAAVAAGTPPHVTTPYPGRVLQTGSSGDSVRFVQSYLSALGGGIPKVTVDGKYGTATRNAVSLFQAQHGLKADGKVGAATWSALIAAFNNTL